MARSEWALLRQQSPPWQGQETSEGFLRFGCGFEGLRIFRDEDALEEVVDAIAAAVPGLTRGTNLFAWGDPETVSSVPKAGLSDAPFVVVTPQGGSITTEDYGVGSTQPTTERVSWWVVLFGRKAGPAYDQAKTDLLYPALAAVRGMGG